MLQVARESYLQWCKENDKRRKQLQQAQSSTVAASSSTVTSATLGVGSPRSQGGTSPRSVGQSGNSHSPRPVSSPRLGQVRTPDPECSYASKSEPVASPPAGILQPEHSWETDSIFSRLPPEVFGLHNWEEAGLMARVLATSQQEYLDSLKARNQSQHNSPGPSTSR